MKSRKSNKGGRRCGTMTVSIPYELLPKVKARASQLRRNLSNYVQVLLERDVTGSTDELTTK